MERESRIHFGTGPYNLAGRTFLTVSRGHVRTLTPCDITRLQESFALLNVLFADPVARYPIMALVHRVFASKHTLPPIVSLSRSLFLESMVTSILADKSATLFERELIALVIIMPYMAIYAPSRLRELLPSLLATLARAICWKDDVQGKLGDDETQTESLTEGFIGNHSSVSVFVENEDPGPYAENMIAELTARASESDWTVMGETQTTIICRDTAKFMDASDPLPYDPQRSIDASALFTFIYGLFPCNTVAFLRR